MKRVTIMRGIPGSGKSTYAKQTGGYVVSADRYHIINGVYIFKKENAAAAHNYCLRQFLGLLEDGCEHIVVDNTNVKVFEIAPYYRLAEALGFEVEIVYILCPPDVGVQRTEHAVPIETVTAMANGFEPLPPWWKQTILTWR